MCVLCIVVFVIFFFQAEDGIRDLVRPRGLGDVYKRQAEVPEEGSLADLPGAREQHNRELLRGPGHGRFECCLLYTSDAADERSSVDLGGRRIIKKNTYIICLRPSITTQNTYEAAPHDARN